MQKMLAQVAGRPDEFFVIQGLAGTQQFSGRYRQAARAPDVQAGAILVNAAASGLAGLYAGNDKVMEGLTLDKNKQTQESAVLAALLIP